MKDSDLSSYPERHKPYSEFASRSDYLEHELQIMAPRRWKPNLPWRDYRFEVEDWVPAMAATIGKIVMVAAVVAAEADETSTDADETVAETGGTTTNEAATENAEVATETTESEGVKTPAV